MNDPIIPILITEEYVFSRILPRRKDSHKGSYGLLLAVCGSSRYRGAAVLACSGALRSGGGIVCMAGVEPVLSAILSHHVEPVLLPLPMVAHGGVDAHGAISVLTERMEGADALLIGCGMGNTRDTFELVCHLLAESKAPIVIDADGLNALSAFGTDLTALLKQARRTPILTPHIGEFARLSGLSIADIKASPETIAAEFAKEKGCVLVLKDAVTHVASPDGRVWQNTTGNPGLARGGSGDVLAGIIASLAAQGLDPIDAASCGVWLHGAAADDCAKRLSMAGMLPSDLAGGLCNVFLRNGR